MPRTVSPEPLPPQLEELRSELERWRADPNASRRIPEETRSLAVGLTREFGVYRTARSGGLDYGTLKRRAGAAGEPKAPSRRSSKKRAKKRSKKPSETRTFLELRPASPSMCATCLVEVEDRAGAKMRFHLTGADASSLAALARSFLREEE